LIVSELVEVFIGYFQHHAVAGAVLSISLLAFAVSICDAYIQISIAIARADVELFGNFQMIGENSLVAYRTINILKVEDRFLLLRMRAAMCEP